MEPPRPSISKHFVLVHGSCLGAWSWYKLLPLLKSSGHNVTALDLAASGVNPVQLSDLRSISDFFRPLRNFMETLPPHERVILVGHSLGGLAISQAMESFPSRISVAVFLTALMPGPTLNISTLNQESFSRQDTLLDSRFSYDKGQDKPPTSFIFGPLYLASNVFQLSPTEDLALATMLLRPLPLFSDEDLSMELMLSTGKYGSVNRVYIMSEKDKVGKRDFQWWMIERNPPNCVVEITGSDHMVMMSKPKQLWARLQEIAEKYS
ncbi:salicylic acid-binding protein 2-like [Juglans microcarpa x Juglans regia]|uniref:salicylic acid-binding protein 2-like n=1 Tax=Juglans microcarpa x Juglans regia TaxID=2249226 RepID=UPI001B7E84DC|nr:salicylic acid-binding protein 2-like [Juglans microcarpa x Juglans regia]